MSSVVCMVPPASAGTSSGEIHFVNSDVEVRGGVRDRAKQLLVRQYLLQQRTSIVQALLELSEAVFHLLLKIVQSDLQIGVAAVQRRDRYP